MSIPRVPTAVVVVVLSLVSGCKKTIEPPTISSLTGPDSGFVGEALTFQVTGTDPGGADVSYELQWGDTSSLAWTGNYPSGQQTTVRHTYLDTGAYQIRAKVRNTAGDESDWSSPHSVAISRKLLPMPVVVYTAIPPNGAGVRVTWAAVTGAEYYRIATDDTAINTTATYCDLMTPTQLITVRACDSFSQGEAATIDCSVTETSPLVLYGISDPNVDHPAGLAFTSNGSATALSLSDANKPTIDYVCDDENISPVGLVNAGDYGWSGNTKLNTSMDAGTTDYDALDQAATSGYSTQTTIAYDRVYALWMSNSAYWTVYDHFAKAKIMSIEDVGGVKKVTLRIGYQKIGGLRWLKTQ